MRPASTLVVAASILAAGPCLAQTAPVNGIRSAEVRTHAITGATVVVSPVETLESATIVIRDGVIEAVGPAVLVPANARIYDGTGLTVYAGLIDAAVLVDVSVVTDGAGAHFSKRVHPQAAMSELSGPDESLREALRKLGFTAAAVYPSKGLFRGSGTVIALADKDEHVLAYAERAAMAVGFDRGGRDDREYPRSLMGAIAIIRQTLYDAQWYGVCLRIWREDPQGHEPPLRADALAALTDVILGRQLVLFDVSDEHNAFRAARILDEFELDGVLLGSGLEFRRLDAIVALERPIILTLNYAKRPQVASLLEADDVSLQTMMTWEQAPTNARRLLDSGATIAITTHRLDKRKDFHPALAKAIKHGLDESDALAALTTTPAQLLGLESVMGTIEAGKVANLVVVEGSLFLKKPKIRDTWINGRRHEISREP
ncbi:MAG: amidohydrolase family protein, partial [Phycisphaerales bacterium]